MRSVIWCGALVVAAAVAGHSHVASAAGAAVGPTYSAEAEFFAGRATVDYDNPFQRRANTHGAAARATVWLAPWASVQLDGNVEQWKGTGLTGDASGVVGHANVRTQYFLLGFYGGRFKINFGDLPWQAYGVEGQAYVGPVTVEGRVGKMNRPGTTSSMDQWRVAGRLFFGDNTMIEVNGGAQRSNWGDRNSNIGAVVEHKFAMAPVSIFAAVDRGRNEICKYNTTAARFGIRLLFNQMTLRSEDKTGSSLGRGFDFPSRILCD
jgi:hypothetical protein